MFKASSVPELIQKLPTTSNGFSPFRLDVHKHLAFGVIPARRKYELHMERYNSAARILTPLLGGGKLQILDIGCGEGFMKFFLGDLPADWFGIEIWKDRAEYCELLGYKIYQVDLNNSVFPWGDNSFDLVIASHVFEHLSNLSNALRESGRVLKPGGLLLIATPTAPPGIASLKRSFFAIFKHQLGETQNAFSYLSLRRECLRILGWGPETIVDIRGFRIFSARKHLSLENWKWFYNRASCKMNGESCS